MQIRHVGVKTKRVGHSRAWRAEQRRRAEAEHARRKRAREAKRGTATREGLFAADAQSRYFARQLLFAEQHGRLGRGLHALAWLVHNCIAHPLLGVLPCEASVWLHDRTADWLNLSPTRTRSALPQISNYFAWLIHNCVAHPAIGLAPLRRAFRAHDHSATTMKVEGWL